MENQNPALCKTLMFFFCCLFVLGPAPAPFRCDSSCIFQSFKKLKYHIVLFPALKHAGEDWIHLHLFHHNSVSHCMTWGNGCAEVYVGVVCFYGSLGVVEHLFYMPDLCWPQGYNNLFQLHSPSCESLPDGSCFLLISNISLWGLETGCKPWNIAWLCGRLIIKSQFANSWQCKTNQLSPHLYRILCSLFICFSKQKGIRKLMLAHSCCTFKAQDKNEGFWTCDMFCRAAEIRDHHRVQSMTEEQFTDELWSCDDDEYKAAGK